MTINLTQHAASPAQRDAGVVDLPPGDQAALRDLLTFEELPSISDMQLRARKITRLIPTGVTRAMIGGAPWFLPYLAGVLRNVRPDVTCVMSFSRRESADRIMPDGSTRKVSVFRHIGFIPYFGVSEC